MYLYVKAFHIISVIAWMAGMLYLPRLFVYHTQAPAGSEMSETFKVMERRLFKLIINPAMISAWTFGLILVFWYGVIDWSSDFWFHAKLMLVILLSGFHGALSRWRKDFEADRNTHSERFYRISNEVPALIMVIVVLLVVVRPF